MSEHVYISPIGRILTLSPSSPGGPEGPVAPGSPAGPGCPSRPAGPTGPFSPCRTNEKKNKYLVNAHTTYYGGKSYLYITTDYFIFLSYSGLRLLSVS